MAPSSTITGRVALTGPTIVRGRCLIPMYPNTHDTSTIADLASTSRCASTPRGANSSTVPSNHPQPNCAEQRAGRKKRAQKSVLSSSTGNTSFRLSAFFLATS